MGEGLFVQGKIIFLTDHESFSLVSQNIAVIAAPDAHNRVRAQIALLNLPAGVLLQVVRQDLDEILAFDFHVNSFPAAAGSVPAGGRHADALIVY